MLRDVHSSSSLGFCRMAEAKERNSTSAVPADMQSVLKRCDNLEKEVRSLRLNLSFMNRSVSEYVFFSFLNTKMFGKFQTQYMGLNI